MFSLDVVSNDTYQHSIRQSYITSTKIYIISSEKFTTMSEVTKDLIIINGKNKFTIKLNNGTNKNGTNKINI